MCALIDMHARRFRGVFPPALPSPLCLLHLSYGAVTNGEVATAGTHSVLGPGFAPVKILREKRKGNEKEKTDKREGSETAQRKKPEG